MRRAFENLFAFLLRHTAEHPELLALLLKGFEVGEAVEDLLLGLVADGAGVVQDQIGLLDGLHPAVALGNERADHLFGVVHVHLAAEGFQVERFLGTN